MLLRGRIFTGRANEEIGKEKHGARVLAFTQLAGYVERMADEMVGGDWDGDGKPKDERFQYLVHLN